MKKLVKNNGEFSKANIGYAATNPRYAKTDD